jgi:hypothetical protein
MKTFDAILSIAFANVLLLGQTLSRGEANPPVRNPVGDRLERLSKTFPPELAATTKDRATVTRMRSHCVSPNPTTRSLSIKPCAISPYKLRVVPPFENIVPKTKPATPTPHIR